MKRTKAIKRQLIILMDGEIIDRVRQGQQPARSRKIKIFAHRLQSLSWYQFNGAVKSSKQMWLECEYLFFVKTLKLISYQNQTMIE